LNAVVGAVLVVGLVESPGQVVREWNIFCSGTPAPLTLATFLSASGPVVVVVSPIFLRQIVDNL